MQDKKNPTVVGLVVVVILAVIAYGSFKYFKSSNDTVANPVTTVPETTNPDGTVAYVYKDGEYSALGDYYSPAGPEQINVSLTLKDDVVTAVTVTPKATIKESLGFQKQVAQNISSLVVGKKLDELNITKVSGSSLTPKGFNDALVKIKASARA